MCKFTGEYDTSIPVSIQSTCFPLGEAEDKDALTTSQPSVTYNCVPTAPRSAPTFFYAVGVCHNTKSCLFNTLHDALQDTPLVTGEVLL
jgi:hypothetical protein